MTWSMKNDYVIVIWTTRDDLRGQGTERFHRTTMAASTNQWRWSLSIFSIIISIRVITRFLSRPIATAITKLKYYFTVTVYIFHIKSLSAKRYKLRWPFKHIVMRTKGFRHRILYLNVKYNMPRCSAFRWTL